MWDAANGGFEGNDTAYSTDTQRDGETGRSGGCGSQSIADSERMAIGMGCALEGSMNFILTDSQAALRSVINLSKGQPPRSGIEREIKDFLVKRSGEDTAIAWIRSHIGIPGNEKADKLASFTSTLGHISSADPVATEGGVRQTSKAVRASFRSGNGFGKRRTEWHRHALSGLVIGAVVPTRLLRIHLHEDKPRPTEELAASHRKGRGAQLSMRP